MTVQKKPFFITLFAQFIQPLVLFLFYYVGSRNFDESGFSLLAYSRRLGYFGQYLFLMGSHIALIYFSSSADERGISGKGSNYGTRYGLFILSFASIIYVSLVYIKPEWCSILFYGDSKHVEESKAIIVLTFGMAWITFSSYFYLMEKKYYRMNIMQILGSLIPLIAITNFNSSSQALIASGLMCFIIAMISFLTSDLWSIRVQNNKRTFIDFFSFGASRMFYEVMVALLFAIAPIVVAHNSVSANDVTLISIGLSLVSIVSLPFSTFGLLLMPSLRDRFVLNGVYIDALEKKRLIKLTSLVISFICIFVFIGYFYGEAAFRLWIGQENIDGSVSHVISLMVVSSGFYAIYALLKNPIDTISLKSYNTRCSLVSLFTFISLLLVSEMFEIGTTYLFNTTIITTISFIVLGSLSLMIILKMKEYDRKTV